MPATAVSLWPTPTVSTITTSKPAASHNSSASRVCSATPPSAPEVGLGRMKAAGCTDSRSMRVLSPRIEPPETVDDGSTASTATRWPCAISCSPSASMKVLLPTPGTPEMPMRSDAAGVRQQGVEQRVGFAPGGRRASTPISVMALASARRSPPPQCVGQTRGAHAPTALRICSSTSFALAGIGVPGP